MQVGLGIRHACEEIQHIVYDQLKIPNSMYFE